MCSLSMCDVHVPSMSRPNLIYEYRVSILRKDSLHYIISSFHIFSWNSRILFFNVCILSLWFILCNKIHLNTIVVYIYFCSIKFQFILFNDGKLAQRRRILITLKFTSIFRNYLMTDFLSFYKAEEYYNQFVVSISSTSMPVFYHCSV